MIFIVGKIMSEVRKFPAIDMKELSKAYDPKQYEDAMYERWENSGFFNPDNLKGEPYSIMMPPPNVTGVLHLGHALENSLMDTMARYQRMRGKKVLLLPGTDHAAVATQAKVEKLLQAEGVKRPREELGREKLLERIRSYSEESKATILNQIKKMGTSCDWSRLAYTFDDERSRAVNEMFVRMHNDGLIYRGARVVNWSVKGQSTCSDDELEYVERPAKLYYFKYSQDWPITIATTRPETKLGDTAVAVNPSDERYRHLIGQIISADVGAAKPLQIKIIASEAVDPAFGTGALGVTPAHSQIDFDVYEQQKAKGDPIELVQVIGQDGKMTAEAGSDYVGLTIEAAREKFVSWLEAQGLLEKVEDIKQNVGTHSRFGDVVEALPLTQWFVAVNKEIPGKGKTLKDLMREAVTTGHNGDPSQTVQINPDNFKKIYLHWIDNLRDWCISRQIWWGHRIPVYYCKGGEIYNFQFSISNEGVASRQSFKCGEPIVSVEKINSCPYCGGVLEQDNDTLDTWFSSGLWTFSTLGWPNNTAGLKTFHPTSWMQMGHEILFFWMARMILMSTYALDQIPFKDVYIHGILRDEHGKKFSKSSGNGVDPIEVIGKYGCDALRWSVLAGISPGNDARFYNEKIEGARNLVNKLWNMARFMLLTIPEPDAMIAEPIPKTDADHWILSVLNQLVVEVGLAMDSFEFSAAGERLRGFTWDDLADWYLEIAKIEGDKAEMLNYILNTLLKLWHPFLPFVTETIWQEVYGHSALLMIEKFPEASQRTPQSSAVAFQSRIIPVISKIRSLRADNAIEPSKKLKVAIGAGVDLELFERNASLIKQLRTGVGELTIARAAEKQVNAIGHSEFGIDLLIDLAGVIDPAKEKVRLEKEIAKVAPYVNAQKNKLAKADFVAHAPVALVEGEQKKLADAEQKLAALEVDLKRLS